MTQVPNYIVEDGTGLNVLAEIASILGAVRDDNAGPLPPPNPVAFMKWRDTSVNPSVLRIRNAANTAWVSLLNDLGIYGVGSDTTVSVNNLDTHSQGGPFVMLPTAVGNPMPGWSGHFLHMTDVGTAWARQVLWIAGSNRWFWRFKDNGVWSAWTEGQIALGFTPVEQGGGGPLGANKIRLGWSSVPGEGGLRAQIDATPVGRLVRQVTTVVSGNNDEIIAPGSPPLFACRAWAHFDGQGAVSLKAGGNVSSITDLTVGTYRMNHFVAMPDSWAQLDGSCEGSAQSAFVASGTFQPSSTSFFTKSTTTGAFIDNAQVTVSVCR